MIVRVVFLSPARRNAEAKFLSSAKYSLASPKSQQVCRNTTISQRKQCRHLIKKTTAGMRLFKPQFEAISRLRALERDGVPVHHSLFSAQMGSTCHCGSRSRRAFRALAKTDCIHGKLFRYIQAEEPPHR